MQPLFRAEPARPPPRCHSPCSLTFVEERLFPSLNLVFNGAKFYLRKTVKLLFCSSTGEPCTKQNTVERRKKHRFYEVSEPQGKRHREKRRRSLSGKKKLTFLMGGQLALPIMFINVILFCPDNMSCLRKLFCYSFFSFLSSLRFHYCKLSLICVKDSLLKKLS